MGTHVSRMAEMAKNGDLLKNAVWLFDPDGELPKQPAAPQVTAPQQMGM